MKLVVVFWASLSFFQINGANLRVERDSTTYYKCQDGRFNKEKNLIFFSFPGMEQTYHQCIDFKQGQPVFVRGTLSMNEYFEGFIDARQGNADLSWFRAEGGDLTARGGASIHFTGFDDGFNATGEYTGEQGGPWLAWNCKIVSNATAEDMRNWCLWSDLDDLAATDAKLNKSQHGLLLSSFSSGTSGSMDFCYPDQPDVGRYIYVYKPEECRSTGLNCIDYGYIEQGRLSGLRPHAGALQATLAHSYGYFGTWFADSGPGKGNTGSSVLMSVWRGPFLELRGFYCNAGAAAGPGAPPPLVDCYTQSFIFITQPAICAARPAGISPLLLSTLVPVLATALALALALAACRRRRPEPGDAERRDKAQALRRRLGITAQDGFRLPSDPPPPCCPAALAWIAGGGGGGGRGVVYLQESWMEAAARLSLWEDFDVDQLDALCASLQNLPPPPPASPAGPRPWPRSRSGSSAVSAVDGGGGASRNSGSWGDGRGGVGRAGPYLALREWLLEEATALLDPREDPAAAVAAAAAAAGRGRDRLASLRQTAAVLAGAPWFFSSTAAAAAEAKKGPGVVSGAEERWCYCVRVVGRCRAWRDEGGSLFRRLQEAARGFMVLLARECDLRFEEMAREPMGADLVAFHAARTRAASAAAPRGADADVADIAEARGARDSGILPHVHTGTSAGQRSARPHAAEIALLAAREGWLRELELLADGLAGNVRQDDLRIRAVRVSEEDQAESWTKKGGLRDEEVLLAQLHRRARVLNQDFQDTAAAVVRARSLPPVGPSRSISLPISRATDSPTVALGPGRYWAAAAELPLPSLDDDVGPSVEHMSSLVRTSSHASFVGRSVLDRPSSEIGWDPSSPAGTTSGTALFECCFLSPAEGSGALGPGVTEAGLVGVQPAPVKTVGRMREKLAKYAGGFWPLSSNILDPVRLSVVCRGPSHILQAAYWFVTLPRSEGDHSGGDGGDKRNEVHSPRSNGVACGNGVCENAARSLELVRIKNKFAFARSDVPDGYRDLKIYMAFTGDGGARIIGEIQIHDAGLFYLKHKMHKLYKVTRANSFDLVATTDR